MTADDTYNAGHAHEALHTAFVLSDAWQRHVVEARCAAEFPDVKAAADRVAEAMADFYQLVGQKRAS